MSYTEQIGWRNVQCIERLLKWSGLDRSTFALKLNINRFTLNRLLNGEVLPTAHVIQSAQRAFPPEMFDAALTGKEYQPGNDAGSNENGSYETKSVAPAVDRNTDTLSPGDRVARERKKHDMSTDDLARIIHLSKRDMIRLEAGDTPLTIRRAQRIAEVFSVGEDYLLYGRKDRRDYPVNANMINYLWEHPELRQDLWKKMDQEQDK